MSYEAFVASKLAMTQPSGIASGFSLPASLFPHQSALTAWALRRGRAAIFADTGLGKMRMELTWADAVRRHTKQPVIIMTPLAVAAQLAAEAKLIGIEATVCREAADLTPGINITNYDRLHKFDTSAFGGVVLDESGCIKHHDTKTFSTLTAAFKHTPFKLPATATPAPNDWTELGTHAEFLGICTRQEMLAEFFCHDGADTSVWRLKGHARSVFWRWVSTWGAMIRKPSALGFDDGAYNLPPLHLHEHQVDYQMPLNGMLFAAEAQTLSERREARRVSMADRVAECASRIFGDWNVDGLEAAIRRYAQAKGANRPSISSQAECAIHVEQGGEEGVHGGVLQSEPGEVPKADAGTTSNSQRSSHQEIRGVRSDTSQGALQDQRMAGGKPGEAEGAETSRIQVDAGTTRPDACGAIGAVRDMSNSAAGAQDVSDGGPLPQDWQGSRTPVLPVQHGAGKVHGQPGTVEGGDCIPLEPWLIWCDLNAEQDALKRAFGDLAFSVQGSDTVDEKEAAILGWLAGERPIMISKPSIMGWGLNFQHCARMAFVGVTDSYEAYYQAVRRCWRFGQTRDMHVHIFSSKAEGAIVANLKRKEREAGEMADSLSAETRDAVMAEVTGSNRETNSHDARHRVVIPNFLKAAA